MTSRRSLGGGRILGNGRSLSPAVAAAPQHKRNITNTSIVSPSESSVSLSSQVSTSQNSTEPQDLSSRVSLEQNEGQAAAVAAASSKLVCPICNEEMVTLLQLNRHLDDAHRDLEELEQDEVKTWFKAQITKAKKFQPLAVLNQKLKGLDVFESNESQVPTPPPIPTPNQLRPAPEPVTRIDPDEAVTRAHWQRPGPYDACLEPTCGKRLGGSNGSVNCRKCGKLFCDEHTMYQMKLSRSALHEPVRGFWCRVCETCYKSREGYTDTRGFERDQTNDFAALRRKTVDKAYLEVSRLEKRLTKLTQLLTNPPTDPGQGGLLWSLTGTKAQQQRQLEQTVVTWEEDSNVLRCPFCQQEFSNYSFRRHHCRLCGRVVCGDPTTGCSSEIGLNVAAQKQGAMQVSVDIRMCKECKHTVFSKSDFARELALRPPDQRAYENLKQFERGIRLLLPKFQRLLLALQDPETPPSPAQLTEAQKVRKRLMDSFTQYDTAARRIRDLPTMCSSQQLLQKAVYQSASSFLHLHMLPLKSLPKILKHATPNGSLSSPGKQPAGATKPRPNGALASIQFNNNISGQPPPLSSPSSIPSTPTASSAELTALETEEKELREQLIVLEEQKFFVQEMVADANKRRKFDEVSALAQSLEDLGKEVDTIQKRLEGLDFEGAYRKGQGQVA
ncbi:MAG: carboxypeptidase Y-deficient [Bogoriella megaspora]|nr:MAG: carboxypeptidase Y-deficient [Bogoriella megaspora]